MGTADAMQDRPQGGSEEGIKREHADAKESEAKKAGTALLDAIERTRAEQGNYFIEIGKRGNVVEAGNSDFGNDSRLIAFKTPVEIDGVERAVVVTQDGPFFVSGGTSYSQIGEGGQPLYIREGLPFSNGQQEFIKRVEEIQNNINAGDYVPAGENKGASVYTHGYGSHERRVEFNLTPITDESIVVRARDESIKNTVSPHVERYQQAQDRTLSLQSLTNRMAALPPR